MYTAKCEHNHLLKMAKTATFSYRVIRWARTCWSAFPQPTAVHSLRRPNRRPPIPVCQLKGNARRQHTKASKSMRSARLRWHSVMQMNTYIRTYIHTYVSTYTHKQTRTPTRARTHIFYVITSDQLRTRTWLRDTCFSIRKNGITIRSNSGFVRCHLRILR